MLHFLGGYIYQITPDRNQHFTMTHEKAECIQGENEAGMMRMWHETVQP